MHSFFNDKKSKNFLEPFTLRPKVYTIVIVFINGNSIEHECIENPWAYMNVLKKNPQVKTCYIKN